MVVTRSSVSSLLTSLVSSLPPVQRPHFSPVVDRLLGHYDRPLSREAGRALGRELTDDEYRELLFEPGEDQGGCYSLLLSACSSHGVGGGGGEVGASGTTTPSSPPPPMSRSLIM